MRWAIPASLIVHVGLIGAAWLVLQLEPEDLSQAEAAVSIEIIAMEDAVSEPSDSVSEESVNLVSAGVTQEAAEPVEVEATEPEVAVRPAEPVAAAPVETAVAVEVEDVDPLVSASVLTATPTVDAVQSPIPQVVADLAPEVVDSVAPSDAPILERLDHAAQLTALQPEPEMQQLQPATITPVAQAPTRVANLTPVEEVVEELADAPPIPAPRITRKPVEAEQKPVEKKAAEKPAEKQPVEKKKKQVASLGNGGAADADSAAAKAAGASAGKVVTAGAGTLDAYQGKVRSRLIKAVRKPSGRYDGGEARVMFTLDARGRVLSASLSRSSGDAKVDNAVLSAVERAAPFPPFPEGTGKQSWSFTFPLMIQ